MYAMIIYWIFEYNVRYSYDKIYQLVVTDCLVAYPLQIKKSSSNTFVHSTLASTLMVYWRDTLMDRLISLDN
jgi:hypothetical protein